jgi:dienelactone hydrolase
MVSAACAELGPLVPGTDYKPKGQMKKTSNGLVYYETWLGENKVSDAAIIGIYDIVGIKGTQTLQQFDRVSEALGVKVVCPDLFLEERSFPGGMGALDWAMTVCTMDQMKERILDMRQALREEQENVRIAAFGFCYGGLVAQELSHWTGNDQFVAAGFIHAKTFTPDAAKEVKCPVINLPSSGEEDQTAYMEALPEEFREKSVYKHFKDVPHGFAAARGDWTNQVKHDRAREAIDLLNNFMLENLVKAK